MGDDLGRKSERNIIRMKTETEQPASAGRMPPLVRLRLRLAAWIAGGEAHQFEGRKRDGSWVKGPIILTPAGMDAVRAAFRHDASVFVDTSLRDLPDLPNDEVSNAKRSLD